MENKNKLSGSDSQESLTSRWGCGIFLASTILFAIQRFILFSVLLSFSNDGNQFFGQIFGFLFGNPPYSFLDILFGFQIPDEGLIFLLQPHNLLLGLVQAIHFGINLTLVSGFVWVIGKFWVSTKSHRIFRISGCIASSLLIAGFIYVFFIGISSHNASSRSIQNDTGSSLNEMQEYSSNNFGISFYYPTIMKLEANSQKANGSGGESVTLTTVYVSSNNPVIALFISIIEDPLRNVLFPHLYPNISDQSLRSLVLSSITNLEYTRTDANNLEAMKASDNAKIIMISGFKAATYQTGLEDTSIGHAYVKGALIITNRRDIDIYLMGCDEPDKPGSINSPSMDNLWEKIINSLRIDF
jgi:hypothetical protein